MPWYDDGSTLRFAVGIEDTFIPQTPFGERPLDEYEMTQHYQFWHSDLALAAEAGATMVRWGIPWYRVNPERDRWDWSWLDRVAERFSELGLTCIVDLMHYGTPMWLENEFVHHDYPARVAEYGARVAERYRGTFDVFTPLNEPMLNALYCGAYGYWPPYLRGDDGLVKVVRALASGIVETQHAISAVSSEASFVHVEAAFRFQAADAGADVATELAFLRDRAYLIQDLVTGRVGTDHPLLGYLQRHGMADADLDRFRERPAPPDVMGVNYYPALSTELVAVDDPHDGGPRDPRSRTNAWTEGLEDVLTSFADRYRRPVFLTETCWTGSHEERIAWLDASVECVEGLRGQGVPVVGYTWWSLIDMYEWPYRDSTGSLEDYHLAMGLWDLVPDGAGVLQRVKNPVAHRFAEHARPA